MSLVPLEVVDDVVRHPREPGHEEEHPPARHRAAGASDRSDSAADAQNCGGYYSKVNHEGLPLNVRFAAGVTPSRIWIYAVQIHPLPNVRVRLL